MRIGFALVLGVLAASPACAQGDGQRLDGQRARSGFVSVYASKWADTSLPRFPIDLVTGKLDFERPVFVGLGVNRVLISDFAVPIPLTGASLRRNSLELEGQLLKHFRGQDHVEATAAIVARTGELGLFGRTSINFALANGLSYAFSRPDYERGPGGVRGEGSRRLQYHIGFEAELTPSRDLPIHLVAKLHHRSGIYGLISPRRTGSNFLGGGVRIDF